MQRGTFARIALLLGPPLTLACGVGSVILQDPSGTVTDRMVIFSLIAAALSPALAALVLVVSRKKFDPVMIALAGTLTAIGTTALFALSATSGPDGSFYREIVVRHSLFVSAGFGVLVIGVVVAPRLELLVTYPLTMLAIAFGLTATTVVFGESVNGAKLWLRVGSIQFQPSEIARIVLAAFVASYVYERRHLMASPWRVRSFDLPPAPYLVPVAGAILGSVGVLLLQNDLGMAALVALGAIASVLSVMRSRGATSMAVLVLAGTAVTAYVLVGRVRDRVASWIDPWADPTGSGFQFIQSDYAFGQGALFGSPGSPANTVPEVHTDFILVAIGAELGAVVALAIIVVGALLVCRCVVDALRAESAFASILALSVAFLFGIQMVLILGGTLRVLPLTGLTLPLVSYGGTSMLVTLFTLGCVSGIGAASPRSLPGSRNSDAPLRVGGEIDFH
jgi:cell division protein FtsW (lipid II flippase)